MKYTVAEFKKNTRKILNEALTSPVTITRFDDEFILTTAEAMNRQTEVRVESVIPDKILDKLYQPKKPRKTTEQRVAEVTKDAFVIQQDKFMELSKNEPKQCKHCDWILDSRGKCSNKQCKGAKK